MAVSKHNHKKTKKAKSPNMMGTLMHMLTKASPEEREKVINIATAIQKNGGIDKIPPEQMKELSDIMNRLSGDLTQQNSTTVAGRQANSKLAQGAMAILKKYNIKF